MCFRCVAARCLLTWQGDTPEHPSTLHALAILTHSYYTLWLVLGMHEKGASRPEARKQW